jgi:adenylate cyclase
MSTDLFIILSSDWVESTATRTRLGEEPADALQVIHDGLLRKVIEGHGGHVIKHSGDGVLATFRSALGGLNAAVDIQKEFASYSAAPGAIAPLVARVGLAAGEVKHLTGDIFGRPVVEAVRLQSLAGPGGILCSDLVRVLTYGRGGFEFDDRGVLELKGLTSVQAHRVTRAASADSAAPAAAAAAPAVATELRPPRRPAEAAEASIAVLPFVNMSADAEQEYFSDGLSEELINQLAQINALRVAGRTSSFAFKNKTLDFVEIGTKLGVRYVLEGSVRKAGKRLRITAQLIKCADGFHLWSERFDRDLDDVFAIQDEIAQAVADKLRVTFGVGITRTPGGTENAEAYDLMLRARSLVRRRQAGDADRAVGMLRKALELDPRFALGWNVLGNALTSVLTFGPENPHEHRKQIEDALGRSVALAPDLWTGHEAHANLLELRHDWVGAEQANARARALAPKSMREPVVSRCHQLGAVGRIHEAIEFGRESIRIEPLAPLQSVAELLFYVGRHAESQLEYERERDLSNSPFVADMLACGRMMAIGDHAKAKHYLKLAAEAEPGANAYHGKMLEVFDDAPRARALIRSVVEAPPQRGDIAARGRRALRSLLRRARARVARVPSYLESIARHFHDPLLEPADGRGAQAAGIQGARARGGARHLLAHDGRVGRVRAARGRRRLRVPVGARRVAATRRRNVLALRPYRDA